MTEFFAKHKKVLIFGLVLAVIFLLLTGLSMKNGGTEIKLTQFITREQPADQTSTSNFTQTTSTPTQPVTAPTPAENTPPPTWPDLTISFTEGVGFIPGSKNAHVGQKIIIKNDTLSQINVVELMPKTSALAQGVLIESDASYEFLLVEDGLFTYRELNSQKTGRFFVGE